MLCLYSSALNYCFMEFFVNFNFATQHVLYEPLVFRAGYQTTYVPPPAQPYHPRRSYSYGGARGRVLSPSHEVPQEQVGSVNDAK